MRLGHYRKRKEGEEGEWDWTAGPEWIWIAGLPEETTDTTEEEGVGTELGAERCQWWDATYRLHTRADVMVDIRTPAKLKRLKKHTLFRETQFFVNACY